jgi:hypothetical protein
MKSPKKRESPAPPQRLPYPDSYYTESGLCWMFEAVLMTPVSAHARPDIVVWGWPTKMHDGSGRKVIMVCCDVGALGFVPEPIASEMWKAVEGVTRTFGKGWRSVSGGAKLRGQSVIERRREAQHYAVSHASPKARRDGDCGATLVV